MARPKSKRDSFVVDLPTEPKLPTRPTAEFYVVGRDVGEQFYVLGEADDYPAALALAQTARRAGWGVEVCRADLDVLALPRLAGPPWKLPGARAAKREPIITDEEEGEDDMSDETNDDVRRPGRPLSELTQGRLQVLRDLGCDCGRSAWVAECERRNLGRPFNPQYVKARKLLAAEGRPAPAAIVLPPGQAARREPTDEEEDVRNDDANGRSASAPGKPMGWALGAARKQALADLGEGADFATWQGECARRGLGAPAWPKWLIALEALGRPVPGDDGVVPVARDERPPAEVVERPPPAVHADGCSPQDWTADLVRAAKALGLGKARTVLDTLEALEGLK